VALFQELDRMQADWRVFTPRPGFYDEVGAKYREALGDPDQVVLVGRGRRGRGRRDGDRRGPDTLAVLGRARPGAFGRGRPIRLPGPRVGRELVHEAGRFAADRGSPGSS
jgi:hypothetical protein